MTLNINNDIKYFCIELNYQSWNVWRILW